MENNIDIDGFNGYLVENEYFDRNYWLFRITYLETPTKGSLPKYKRAEEPLMAGKDLDEVYNYIGYVERKKVEEVFRVTFSNSDGINSEGCPENPEETIWLKIV